MKWIHVILPRDVSSVAPNSVAIAILESMGGMSYHDPPAQSDQAERWKETSLLSLRPGVTVALVRGDSGRFLDGGSGGEE